MVGDFTLDAKAGDSDVMVLTGSTFTVAGAGKNFRAKADFMLIGRVDATQPADLPGVLECSGNMTLEADGDATVLTPPLWGASGVWGIAVPVFGNTGNANFIRGSVQVRGKISKTSGSDANLTLKARHGVILSTVANTTAPQPVGGTIESTSNKLNVLLHSDSDNNGIGPVVLAARASIASNGGSIIIGGGLDPTTSSARGLTAVNGTGVTINNASINSGGGAITIRGTGGSANNAYGIAMVSNPSSGHPETAISGGAGNITLMGVGGTGTLANGVALIGTVATPSNRLAKITSTVPLSLCCQPWPQPPPSSRRPSPWPPASSFPMVI
jgi:hypothetical protein